ncbi:UDP-galactose 4-epimerase [Hasllibacter halocynthiae]|uniref:UDP-glucose 4-epimerase n=1 Tax=Hasllibacter halocynthiae TaxID=595589 RepID=A0A2T0X235_9RHOB|nr:UDP-glucose 4-epimerase GalE [Hasllibacter halocynthiae]PRY93012.1 UDP-galactose 4-epimerase [Hasllibacter halocynthiae]
MMEGKGAVLVTGGAGYIGSHACKALRREGFLPVTFDDLSTGNPAAVRFGPLVEGALHDARALDRAFAEHRPIAVMHFAASSQVGEAMARPGRYWRNNLGGSLELLEATVRAGVGALVFSSTCAVYGDRDGEVLDEGAPRLPLNAYGASKRATEDMLRDFEAAHGLRHVIFRYFNVAGADPEGEVGEAHDPETHLIPAMIEAVRGMRPALTIHGTDYATADGTAVRDYVHVLDLCEAHVAGLERLLQGGTSRAYNLGSGTGYSVREVVEAARAVTNREVPVVEGPRRAGDAVRLVSGSRLAADELAWTPTRGLRAMIEDAWRWHTGPGFGPRA